MKKQYNNVVKDMAQMEFMLNTDAPFPSSIIISQPEQLPLHAPCSCSNSGTRPPSPTSASSSCRSCPSCSSCCSVRQRGSHSVSCAPCPSCPSFPSFLSSPSSP